jgi:hypothetical protein
MIPRSSSYISRISTERRSRQVRRLTSIRFYVLVKAYLLGEKFSDQAFKQAIFDRFLTDYENLPSLSAQVDTLSLLRLIRYHNEISLSSRLCKLVMDLFITKTPALSKDDLAYVPDDLKNFIIEAFFAKRDSQGNLDTLT